MITENLTTLKINKLTQKQYDTAKLNGNINDNELYVIPENNTSSIIPSGLIMMYYGNSIPDGWALCDGTNGTPDLRNRFIIGAGDTYTSGDTGGETSHAHKYKISYRPYYGALVGNDNDAIQAYDYESGNWVNSTQISAGESTRSNNGILQGQWSETTPLTEQAEGKSSVTSNMPPYYALCYIMKL